VGWQLEKEGPGLYLGFFEFQRQLPLGVGRAEGIDTRSVLRVAGVLTREGGAGELLLMMTGACRDMS
jgi:hypothetical protein